MGIIIKKWFGIFNIIAGFILIYIFMWLDNWLATVYVICSMVWVIFGWIIFDESLMERLNDKRNTKRLNHNRTNNRMGKSCIKYK